MVSRAHKIKLKPNKHQAIMLAKTAGTARFAYNWGLTRWEECYKSGEKCDPYALSREWTVNRPEWATEVYNGATRKALLNLGGAYKAFFRGVRKHPTFHKKGLHDGFYVSNDKARLYRNKIQLPNIGRVRMCETLRYDDCKIMAFNVKRQADGWYVIIQVELKDTPRTDIDTFVGVDVGCTNLAVASDGAICESPAKLKDLERQLKRRQRLLVRKQKGSNNRAKARLKVARTWQRINNIKQDTVHKFTAAVAKNHGTVCIETLDIKGMQSGDNKYVRKGVQASCMSEILRQLKYKCNNFIEVDRYFPSSKTCSNCGHLNQALTLADRTYLCPSCGTAIDRDMNAALNLRKEGLRIYTEGHSGCACGAAR